MNIEKIKRRLIDVLQEGNIGVCLQEVKKIIKNYSNSEAYQEFTLLSSRYKMISTENRQGLMDHQSYLQNNALVSKSLLEFISNLTDDDVDYTSFLQDEVPQTLFIVANGSAAMKETLEYFNPQIYNSIVEVPIESLTQDIISTNNTLVILSNLEEFRTDGYERMLRTYLDNSSKPEVLYFGKQWDRIDKYRDQVYAANSKFSLHGRIREMIEYLKLKKDEK